jgi:DDE superfamily endonuclease
MNVQVACTLGGGLAWISDAIDGSRHDTYCLDESGVLLTLNPGNWIGDKVYVGTEMITPNQEARPSQSSGLGERIQQGGQQDSLRHRADDRQLQDLANHAHRLSPPDRNIHYDYLNRNRLALLRGHLNKPQCVPSVRMR